LIINLFLIWFAGRAGFNFDQKSAIGQGSDITRQLRRAVSADGFSFFVPTNDI